MKDLNKNEMMMISGGSSDGLAWWQKTLRKVGEALYDAWDFINTPDTKSDYSNSQLFGPGGKVTI
jgi:hypothetical protein